MSRPSFVEVDGRRVRVRVDGDAAKPPVLLLHGIGRSMEDWALQYERLSGTYRVIAVDVPGFGFSDRPVGPITLSTFARGVLGAGDGLGETRPLNIIGNSLGGAIALQTLALRPERVASLGLINSAGFGREVTVLLRMLTVPGLGQLSTRRPTRASARLLERTIFADPSLATKERIDHALAIATRCGERYFEAELCRLQGELLLHSKNNSKETNQDKSRDWFLRSIEVSRELGQGAFEARAKQSLAALWLRQGRLAEAQALLTSANKVSMIS